LGSSLFTSFHHEFSGELEEQAARLIDFAIVIREAQNKKKDEIYGLFLELKR
tara:strand:+ start:557 stop:712 length:156 start_codon:yes stop_codon:yes gene_type:complete